MNEYTQAVYVISVAAELAGVHPQTLRIYERKGLVEPARTRGGSRRYSDADLDRLSRIAQLTDAGLNLAGVQTVLALEREIESLKATVRAREQRIEQLESELVHAVQEAHRQHRRDLVPLHQSLSLYSRHRYF
ncbi:MAG: MerR family transcriptional regulator [Acidimicrobiales bacterium]|nr:MerR family transcriptional regulator [Acidimicrobiales bacterium]